MAKVYLETSFFSACVSTRTTEQAIGWRASSKQWWRNEGPRHKLFISAEVIDELSRPSFPNSDKALEMVRGQNLLTITNEVVDLAELLVRERIMPAPAVSGDAIHVAVATIYQMNYLLSWNVKHLANENKRTHLGVICMRLGLVPPLIYTPDML
ncbi:MAG: type II toxin-antitoxin system VapC family toxin [Tepidisphaeraceae bacterium]|jgi:hypothetical protein